MNVAMPTAEQAGARTRRVDFDPVTRVGGALALHTTVDFDSGRVLDASAAATLFRGYEVVLQGRDARDAIFISSRACGLCGGAHAMCSALAMEMTFDIQPPPMGIVARNLLSAIDNLYEHPTHLFAFAGPDYCEPLVQQTSPALWARAEQALARRRETHGFERMSDIMAAMTPFTGALHLEALRMARTAREAYVLAGGKHPHPQTIVPGGISSTVDATDMNVALLRIVKFLDYSRKVAAVWDDLVDFLYEAEPRSREVGAAPANFIDLGQWDDPYAYDATFENAPAWGERRWATPGAVVGGELRTTDLHKIDMGVEEFAEHSFYEDWSSGDGAYMPADLDGNPLSRNHPFNKRTIPRPAGPDARGKYSWSTAARWHHEPMETGAYARLWITAKAGRQPHRQFIDATGTSLRFGVPQAEMPASELEWRIPESWNALERNRARAYSLVHSTLVAYENLLLGYDLMRHGGPDAKIATHYKMARDHRIGVGLWGGARGCLSHYVEVDDRVIKNYQILAPSTFTASPRDAFGTPGPVEQAAMATPLLSSQQPERCIDLLRAVRSFDACMSCAAH